MNIKYDSAEKINGYIYLYKDNILVAVYNPFIGLCRFDVT